MAASGRAETHIEVLSSQGCTLRQHMSLLLPPRKIRPRIRLRSQGQGWARVCAKDRPRAWSPGAVSVVNAIRRLRRPHVTEPAGGRRLGPGSWALRGEGPRGPGCGGQDRKWQVDWQGGPDQGTESC